MPSAISHGVRTDWLALATSVSKADVDRIQPDRILWMSHKRKRLRLWAAETKGFYLHSSDLYQRLVGALRAPPTTGLMMIDLVIRSRAKSVDLYGFDFFSSLSLTGSRTAAQVPHDFAAERDWANALVKSDNRLTVNN